MIHIYTGDGKGKSTAAFGLALRASGAGLKVFLCQFLKSGDFSELKALRKLTGITVCQFGGKCFVRGKATARDVGYARCAFESIKEAVASGRYHMVVMDEVNVAVALGLLPAEEVAVFCQGVPKKVELVLTGRKAHPKLIRCADLVSEIKEVKHYFRTGVKARRGIEF